jgi:hypothetical protein
MCVCASINFLCTFCHTQRPLHTHFNCVQITYRCSSCVCVKCCGRSCIRVCAHACACVCILVCVCACMLVCMCACACACMLVCIYLCVFFLLVFVYARVHALFFVCNNFISHMKHVRHDSESLLLVGAMMVSECMCLDSESLTASQALSHSA